jgi:hypothetical protein
MAGISIVPLATDKSRSDQPGGSMATKPNAQAWRRFVRDGEAPSLSAQIVGPVP